MRRQGLGVVLFLLSLPVWALPDPLRFPGHGFTIAPLEAPSDTDNVQALIMMLPPTQGFAPNVNVQVQLYAGTMADYSSLSDSQFKTLKFSVRKRSMTEESVFWEYTGRAAGGKMHWYARAFLGDGRVYLVTATALESQWGEVGDPLKACVDSFRLVDGS